MEGTIQLCGTTKYTVETIDGVICLTDLVEGMSINNNAENVIEQLRQNGYDLMNCPVIYADSYGHWDCLEVNIQGVFAGFKTLFGERDKHEAIRKVKQLSQMPPGAV